MDLKRNSGKMHTIPLQVKDLSGTIISLDASLIVWSRERARQLAIRYLLGCWAGALVSVFIPLVHFVSVPGLLLAGPLIGHLTYKLFLNQEEVSGLFACPHCQQEQKLDRLSLKTSERRRWVCTSCRQALEVLRPS